MILQALYELAEREDLVGDPDFEWKPVAWLVRVGAGGRFLGITGTHTIPPEQEGKKKPRPVAKTLLVPYQPGRSGSKPPAQFFVDNAKYVFGMGTPDKPVKPEEGRERSEFFREKIRACAEATGDEAARALLALLQGVAEGTVQVELPEACTPNEQFAFVYADDDVERLVHERPAIRDYWKSVCAPKPPEGKPAFRCLVTGKPVAEPGLFPLIKKAPGGTSSGVSLVGFNNAAFASYNLNGNQNAPISREAALACATALNRLLHPAYPDPHRPGESLPRRNVPLSADTVVCFWAVADEAQDFVNNFAPIVEANPDEVRQTYHSIWKGKLPEDLDPSAFYALTLTGTQGRAIIRDWFESTVREVAENLTGYFRDLSIVRNTPKPRKHDLPPQLPLSVLLRSLALRGDSKEIPAHLATRMTRSALAGSPYPLGLYHRALERMRAEIGDDTWAGLERRDARAALVKAVLIRNFNKEATPQMDPQNHEPGYLLGRLLAVIERTQQAAMQGVNATVIDRYFSGASATPAAVFPRLLKNMRHHVRKLKDGDHAGLVRWLESMADEIMEPLSPDRAFPAHLPLDQQGLFVLGYHHQRHALWQKRNKTAEQSLETAQTEA